MIRLKIMSQAQAVAASKTLIEKTAIVSITVPEQKLPDFAENENIIGIFRMQFWDVSTPVTGIEMPKQSDFDGLKDFVDSMVLKHVEVFLVHCAAGISRSSATAAAISDYLHLDAHIFDNPSYFPNRLVYRLARHEFGLPENVYVPEEEEMLRRYDENDEEEMPTVRKGFGERLRDLISKVLARFIRRGEDNTAKEDSGYARDPAGTVRKVYKLVKNGKSVEQIARKCHISAELAEKIVRLVMTHPEAGADDIIEKMGIGR